MAFDDSSYFGESFGTNGQAAGRITTSRNPVERLTARVSARTYENIVFPAKKV